MNIPRCFYVFLHGELIWFPAQNIEAVTQPRGFYCSRYVLAVNAPKAADAAKARARADLDRQSGWLSDGSAQLTLEAEEIEHAPIRKLLDPSGRGFIFYDKE